MDAFWYPGSRETARGGGAAWDGAVLPLGAPGLLTAPKVTTCKRLYMSDINYYLFFLSAWSAPDPYRADSDKQFDQLCTTKLMKSHNLGGRDMTTPDGMEFTAWWNNFCALL